MGFGEGVAWVARVIGAILFVFWPGIFLGWLDMLELGLMLMLFWWLALFMFYQGALRYLGK